MPRSDTIKRLNATKTVSFFGGLCLLINSMTGAAIPFTPQIFNTTGFLVPTLLFFIFAVISAFAVLFIVEAMQAIPGNRHFQGTVEFSTLINFYFNPWLHVIGQFFLYAAIQGQCIQNIVVTAQTFDNLLIDIFHKTWGVAMPSNGSAFHWQSSFHLINATAMSTDSGSPFVNPDGTSPVMLFTIGLIMVAVLSLPLAISNLDDNITMQFAAFILTCVIVSVWAISSFFTVDPVTHHHVGIQPENVPFAQVQPGWQTTMGTIMQNMACTIFAPSWINLKKRSVKAESCVWTAMAVAIVIYLTVGIFPALGYTLPNSGNIIPALETQFEPQVITKIACYAFAIVMLLPSIPVSFIVSENNLIQNKVVPKWAAVLLCYGLPWLVAIPLQTGSLLNLFISWNGLLFVSVANFVIPFLIYLRCLNFRRGYNESRFLTPKQKILLKEIHAASKTIHNFIDDVGQGSTDRKTGPTGFRRRRTQFIDKIKPKSGRTPSRTFTSMLASSGSIGMENDEFTSGDETINRGSEYTVAEDSVATTYARRPSSSGIEPSGTGTVNRRGSLNKGVRFGGGDMALPATSESRDGATSSATIQSSSDDDKGDAEPWMNEDVPDPEAEDSAGMVNDVEKSQLGGGIVQTLIRTMTRRSRMDGSSSMHRGSKSPSRERSPNREAARSSTSPPNSLPTTAAAVGPTASLVRSSSYATSLHAESRPRDGSNSLKPRGSHNSSPINSFTNSPLSLSINRNNSSETVGPNQGLESIPLDDHVAESPVNSTKDLLSVPTDGTLRASSATRQIGLIRKVSQVLGISNGSASSDEDTELEEVGQHNSSRLGRNNTLPTHPDFVAPAYRAVPKFLKIKGWIIAAVLCTITSLLSVTSTVLFIAFPQNASSNNVTPNNASSTQHVTPASKDLSSEGLLVADTSVPALKPGQVVNLSFMN